MKKSIKNIKVGKTSIQYFEVGAGGPLISIVAGIHGDETNSQLVLDMLLGSIKKINKGTLRIIPLANILAVEENIREFPDDDIDLNRLFPGDKKGNLVNRLTYEIFNLLKNSDLVIDIHNCWMKIPLVNICFKIDNELNEKNKALYELLDSQIWIVDLKKEKEYAGSIGGIFSKMNVPNLTIEIPNPEFSNQKDIDNCVNKLLNILRFLEVIEGKPKRYNPYYYHVKTCEVFSIGIFTPNVRTHKKVKKGDKIGTLKNVITGKIRNIFAPIEGEVLSILEKSFVFPRRWVCILGNRINTQD